ncbi:FMN-binding protein [Microbispora sp. NPDC049125]|uniref:FMN-binding protein n=1 Tax=Microbispora sp. NPDC049125 TaxID=3154929 RepID=UPI003464F3EF
MRRAVLAVLVTAVGLVLLLSFKPHEMTAAAERPAVVAQDDGSAGGPGTSSDDGGSRGSGDASSDDSNSGSGSDSSSGGSSRDSKSGRASLASGSWTGGGAQAGATSGEKVVTGGVADTRWGPVQVQILLSGGKVTGVSVLQAPDGNSRDFAINDQALPTLDDETLSAQSAQIDVVSGATYTSDGYISSLQNALDKAGV